MRGSSLICSTLACAFRNPEGPLSLVLASEVSVLLFSH